MLRLMKPTDAGIYFSLTAGALISLTDCRRL